MIQEKKKVDLSKLLNPLKIEHGCRWSPLPLGCLLRWLILQVHLPWVLSAWLFWRVFLTVFLRRAENSTCSWTTAGLVAFCFCQFLSVCHSQTLQAGCLIRRSRLLTIMEIEVWDQEPPRSGTSVIDFQAVGFKVPLSSHSKAVKKRQYSLNTDHACENSVYMTQLKALPPDTMIPGATIPRHWFEGYTHSVLRKLYGGHSQQAEGQLNPKADLPVQLNLAIILSLKWDLDHQFTCSFLRAWDLTGFKVIQTTCS